MAQPNNFPQGNAQGAQKTPDWLIDKVKAMKAKEVKEFETARQCVPAFIIPAIVGIDRKTEVCKQAVFIDNTAKSLGIWTSDSGTYISVSKPYLNTEGKIAWARYDHRTQGKMLQMGPVVFDTKEKLARITMNSELFGEVTATAKLGVGSTRGVDATNPYENAETSVIGRALSLYGYTLLGQGGISSAEDVEAALEEQEKQLQDEQDKKPTNLELVSDKKTTAKPTKGKAKSEQQAPAEATAPPAEEPAGKTSQEDEDPADPFGEGAVIFILQDVEVKPTRQADLKMVKAVGVDPETGATTQLYIGNAFGDSLAKQVESGLTDIRILVSESSEYNGGSAITAGSVL